jgi:hypothetical protein
MQRSASVISIGAICFGIVIGYVTYRTLVRKGPAVITDIAGVIAAVGGGVVTVWFDQAKGDSFAYYSMGLLAGMILYYVQFLVTNGKKRGGELLTAQVDEAEDMPISGTRSEDELSEDELREIERRT